MHARTHIVCLDIVYKYISGEMSNSEKPLCEQQEKENEKADVEAVCTRVGICAFVLHAYVCEPAFKIATESIIKREKETRSRRNARAREKEETKKRTHHARIFRCCEHQTKYTSIYF